MMQEKRNWLSAPAQKRVAEVQAATKDLNATQIQKRIEDLAVESHELHDVKGINLNPATNILNPRAEKILASGMGSKASSS